MFGIEITITRVLICAIIIASLILLYTPKKKTINYEQFNHVNHGRPQRVFDGKVLNELEHQNVNYSFKKYDHYPISKGYMK
jgi:hypothetical protein